MYRGERLNAATHLAGLLAALPATAWLVVQALDTGSLRRVAAVGVFGAALVAVFAASTLCHSTRGRAQQFWARADHCAIFLLIAGTATPFALLSGRGSADWALLAGVWAVALTGSVLSLFGRRERPMLGVYLASGWMATLACVPALAQASRGSLGLFLAGAGLYTAGTYFFVNPGRRQHAHGIWHLFVVAGSGAHFGAVMACVLP
ncbi:hemolysin III family protein [Mitsuaria sp. GD03876]|uniref:PAQR family membrane homeostasis protein TrhA n=1 Tax=Mitsuaria sp. GD03876 TaxID=2975399 RepID=UPI00244BD277|nr:hemolysin III family protein [Mitsuaria sp. GD03876]MDH0865386.1 hemolysin III family protein [Mitsuaria sp. GD03876]